MYSDSPKIKTYAYLGNMGVAYIDEILVANAREEMDNIQTQVNLMAAQALDMLNDVLAAPDGPGKTEALPSLQANYNRAIGLVQEAVAHQNTFNADLASWGLGKIQKTRSLRGLGVLPVLAIVIASAVVVTALAGMGYAWANAFAIKYRDAAGQHQTTVDYYKAVEAAIKAGADISDITPPSPDGIGGMDFTTMALIGGIGALVIILVVNR